MALKILKRQPYNPVYVPRVARGKRYLYRSAKRGGFSWMERGQDITLGLLKSVA